MTEVEKTVLGLHFKVFRQHVDFLHRQTERFVDSTGRFPLPRDPAPAASWADAEKRGVLPPVELDLFELGLAELLSADGGLAGGAACEAFLRALPAASLENHRILCISILKQTRSSPALSTFFQGGGFSIICPWVKSSTTTSFKLHLVEFLCSPRVKIEKRLDRVMLKSLHDCAQAAAESCRGVSGAGAGGPSPEQAALRAVSLELLKKVRAALNMQGSAAPASVSSTSQKKKLSAADSGGGGDRPQKRLKVEATMKPLGSNSSSSAVKPNSSSLNQTPINSGGLSSGPSRVGSIPAPQPINALPLQSTSGVTSHLSHKPLGSASAAASSTLPQPQRSPFASFTSERSYSSAPQQAADVVHRSGLTDVLRAAENRRSIRWADESAAGELCMFKEFVSSAPPCPEAGGLADDEAAGGDSPEPGDGEQDGGGGIHIDMAIDPRHTHNLVMMKKREHEGERQLLEQSRKIKHPDPEVAVAWRPPYTRTQEPPLTGTGGDGDATEAEAAAAPALDSNELKIQRIRQNKKEEVLYLLTTEIPDDPDHVATPISGNVRMPTNIPWETDLGEEYSDAVPSAGLGDGSYSFADAGVADSGNIYGEGRYDEVAEEDNNDDALSELLDIIPMSVLSLSPGQLMTLVERLMAEDNAALIEDPKGPGFQRLVDEVIAIDV